MGDFIEFLYSRFLLSDGVSIDTRSIKEGNLFFAISGPNFDANQFAHEALEKGASFAVVDDKKIAGGDRIILAENALGALQSLAKFHRSKFKRPVIGLTGSNGKTTTKELIASVLAKKYIVHATKGNFNNHIGVPLTLLHIHPQVEIAIIEMGANHVGEIAELSQLAAPTHGLITNIGHAHTEGFGGFEGVIRGKSELFDYLKKQDGQVLINGNDEVLANMTKRFSNPIIYPEDDVTLLKADPYLEIMTRNAAFETKLIGEYNYENIAAAISIGRLFEVSDSDIAEAIASYAPENARSQVIEKGSLRIILDAYNANPDSMKGAIKSLSKMKNRNVAILGDMNELSNPDKAHQEIIDFAQDHEVELITVGSKMRSENHFQTKEELIQHLKESNFPNTNVLLKASRSIKLETVEEFLQP